MSNYKHRAHHGFKWSGYVKAQWPPWGGASASGYQAALFSLGEMGARALQTRRQYLAFIGFLIKFVWSSDVTGSDAGETASQIAFWSTAWFQRAAVLGRKSVRGVHPAGVSLSWCKPFAWRPSPSLQDRNCGKGVIFISYVVFRSKGRLTGVLITCPSCDKNLYHQW